MSQDNNIGTNINADETTNSILVAGLTEISLSIGQEISNAAIEITLNQVQHGILSEEEREGLFFTVAVRALTA